MDTSEQSITLLHKLDSIIGYKLNIITDYVQII